MLELITGNFDFSTLNIIFAFFGLLITTLTLSAVPGQIEVRRKWFYLLYFWFIISFLVVIFSRSWLLFIVFWEMVTVSVSLMLLWTNRGLAAQYLTIQFIGSSFLLVSILFAIRSGYQEIGPIAEIWLQNCLILGLGMKSALFGLHFWLPPVHSRAAAPVSAILSGWVVKLGFITMLKLITGGNNLLLVLGFLMIFYGGFKALRSSDYKVLLAYSSISQLGYIAVGIGAGTLWSYSGAVLHIIAHGLAKPGLFIGSGYLVKEYGSRCIYDFKELWKRQKLLSFTILACFSSLMGIPFFIGYSSKHLLKNPLNGGVLFMILIHAASIMTTLYSTRFLYWGLFKDIGLSKIFMGFKFKLSSFFRSSGLKWYEGLVLFMVIVLLVSGLFFSSYISALIRPVNGELNLPGGLVLSALYLLISIIILKITSWIKTESKTPSLDRLFNQTNRVIYNFARYLYNRLYPDFQYQLLWVPVFVIVLILWINS
ncbi:MAG TPA: complex I subunit 5 family protein [Halanaerobiales bacterium]|nr:complex I subunit 5 family protein [Halanaerobiales bacterium]